jgi:hypothetical protein
VLSAARFEPRDDERMLVHYQFHQDFLKLLKISASG